jgi:hypothetical protein
MSLARGKERMKMERARGECVLSIHAIAWQSPLPSCSSADGQPIFIFVTVNNTWRYLEKSVKQLCTTKHVCTEESNFMN